MKRLMFCAALVVASIGLLASFAGAATANSTGTITFDSPTYTTGDINNQNGWMKTGTYDVAVVSLASFSDRSPGFTGDQALRLSNSVTSGSFGDQTFSPAVAPAGQSTSLRHFESSFQIGTTTKSAVQPGLSMSVSPDNGSGARMTYLRFEDQVDGIHVFFDQARGATFKETDIATLDRTIASTITFLIDFNAASSKAVTIKINNVVKATGSTWDSYYQTQEHNPTPTVSKMLFRFGGAPSASGGQGFLVDDLTLTSSS